MGAAHQEVDVGLRGVAQAADGVPSSLTEGVRAVAHSLDQIGVRQGLEDLGMGAFAVIITEAVHKKLPAF